MTEARRTSYAWQKLYEASYALATSSADVKKRLAAAASCLVMLKPDAFPDDDMRRTFRGIVDDLTWEQGPDGSIRATTDQLSDFDAEQIGKRIFELFCEIDASGSRVW